MRRAIIALLLAASVAHGQDWHMLGALWTEPSGAVAALGGAVDLVGSSAEFFIDPSTNRMDGASSLSISVWVYVRNSGLSRGIILARSSDSRMLGLVVSSSTNLTSYSSSTTLANFFTLAPNSIPLNAWVHIVSTWDSASRTNSVYINGVVTNYASALTNVITQDASFRIGRDSYGTARYLDGLIDDIGIFYNRKLTANEVSELYGEGINPKPIASLSTGTNGLAGYWTFDDKFTYPAAALTQAVDSVSGTFAIGTGIDSNDFVTGKVTLP